MDYYHFGVLGPPLVEVVPEIIETVEGRNVIAMCNVTGNPRPNRITWKRSDGTLSSARTIVSEGNLTILNITSGGTLLERKISPCQITYSYKAFFPPFRLTGNSSLTLERIITTELTKLFQTMFKI